ncbi:MAG: hypothetical protein GY854_03760 [Deltaproteobacteria bacterium]|nr:hypothetical protein [Deltaproteobacteria bacterium]
MLPIAVACSSQATDVATAKAAPVGIILREQDNLPALEVSIEVSPQVDEQVIVPAFAGAISKARAACEAPAAKLPEVTHALTLKFAVQDGKILLDEPRGLDDPFAMCMFKSLDGSQLPGLDKGSYAVLIQVRARKVSAPNP